MKKHWRLSFWLPLLLAASTGASSLDVRVLDSVRTNVLRAEAALAQGEFAKAEALADMTLVGRTVSYAVRNGSQELADEAVTRWTRALGGAVSFRQAPWNLADLRIEYKPAVKMQGRDVVGLATTRRQLMQWSGGQFAYRLTGSIEVAQNTSFGLPLADDAVLNTTMHEIGHFLGLDDSPVAGDVMGKIDTANPVTWPSESELVSLTTVRERAALLLQQAQALQASTVRD